MPVLGLIKTVLGAKSVRAGTASFCLISAGDLIGADAGTSPLSNSDRETIRRDLQDYSLQGMSRRFGPDYSSYHSNGTEQLPQIWMAPTKSDGARPYQIGGPWAADQGDYSSTQGQILFSPDSGAFGVDRVTVLEMSNMTYSEKPEPPWWGGFRPEPASQSWLAASSALGKPVAMARGMGSWANCGVIVFSSGFVGSAGTCTGSGTNPFLQLGAGKVPTAISVTTKNEFALITVCDVRTRKGQLAVIALQGGNNPAFVHDWIQAYPCLPSAAWHSDMKLLGFIDLPGIEFPTGVCGVGNQEGIRLNGTDGNVTMLGTFDLSQQASRDSFRTGVNVDYASRAGFAVVIAKHENKAAFIDLQPLFKRVHDLYFTTQANFQFTRNLGRGPTQWPSTFDADPIWKPNVVKVVSVPQPTAVIASMSGGDKARAFIASMDGTVGLYRVGGLATEAPPVASDIQRVAEVTVGRNPTCLTYEKLAPNTVIAVSRGDREIAWIANDTLGTRIIRRLRDTRMTDPVSVEMADTHGTETSLITVADFAGRKIINYRYAPVVFWSNGGASFGVGPNGLDQFECGGTLSLPGSPFCISAANVN